MCLEDLEATERDNNPLLSEVEEKVADQCADENVGDVSPQKETKTFPNASENLSINQYLSSSFQNAKRSSKLKQILAMSMTYGQAGVKNSATKHRLETNNRQVPHLISSVETSPQKEEINFRIHGLGVTKSNTANSNSEVSP